MTANLSDGTRKTLEQFGWIDGDPIPANMGDIFADIYTKNPACRAAGLYVDITKLDAGDITTIKTALDEEKVAEKKRQERAEYDAKTAGMSPQMKALYDKVSQPTAAVEIVDDRGAPKEAATEEPEPVVEKIPESEVPEVPLAPEPVREAFCPRCNWDMRQKYEAIPTEEDKQVFMASVLGGTRMQKTYSIMAGKYEVKFRGLLAEENKHIHRQLLLDQKRDEFQSDTEWFLRFFEYRLACSVQAIVADGKLIAIVPELSEVAQTELPNKTDDQTLQPIERLRNYVVGDLLKVEVTRRLVSNKFREFQRNYEALEAMALEPNFW